MAEPRNALLRTDTLRAMLQDVGVYAAAIGALSPTSSDGRKEAPYVAWGMLVRKCLPRQMGIVSSFVVLTFLDIIALEKMVRLSDNFYSAT